MKKKVDITHVRISKNTARDLYIIAKAHDRTIRQQIDAMVHEHVNNLVGETINADIVV